MLTTFGNFRALPVGIAQRAYVQDKATGEIKYLAIEGDALEFVDVKGFPDTPRIPTLKWMNWGLKKGKEICAAIEEQTKYGNVIKLSASIQLEGTLGPTIWFVSENHSQAYKQEIMNFILSFTYGPGAGSVQNSVLAFFLAQQPSH